MNVEEDEDDKEEVEESTEEVAEEKAPIRHRGPLT